MLSLSLLFAAALQFTEADAKLAYKTAADLVENHTPRDAGTIRGQLAANHILDMASMTGADVRRDGFRAMTPRGERSFTNLCAKFENNKTNRWVVLVSHYDTKPGVPCPGANDGASTAGLLVALANAYVNWPTPRGNLLLIWTDSEECIGERYSDGDGFQGSKHAAAKLAEKGLNVQAVICLDMLGDADLDISIPSNSTPVLSKIAVHAARRAGYPGLVKPISDEVKDDHVAFLDNGFPAIDLIDFNYGSRPGLNDYWHTDKDTMERVSEASLLKSGKVIVELLNLLL